METEDTKLSPNTVAFIGLASEYCAALEKAAESERNEFVANMLRLLPRLYITISAHQPSTTEPDSEVIGSYVDEVQYNQICSTVAALMAEEDSYLETFEEDMKYSDTPIAASVSESLADIYQDLCNFVVTVRESEGILAAEAMDELLENFKLYWSKTLCNVMRPLNALYYRD